MILSEEMVDAFVEVWRKEATREVSTAGKVLVDEQDLRDMIEAAGAAQSKLARIKSLESRLAEVLALLKALDS